MLFKERILRVRVRVRARVASLESEAIKFSVQNPKCDNQPAEAGANSLKIASASARWLSRFAFRTEDLMAFDTRLADMGSFPRRAIIAAIGAVILLDAS